MKNLLIIFLVAVLLAASTCKDPYDIVTPKTITPVHGTNYIQLDSMRISEGGIKKNYAVEDIFVEIDTSLKPERIWFSIKLASEEQYNPLSAKFYLDTIKVEADSLPIENTFVQIISNPMLPPYVNFKLKRGMGIERDTSVFSGNQRNISKMLFNLDRNKKEVLSRLEAVINSEKIWMEDRDTMIINEKKFVKGDSIWYEYDTLHSSVKMEVRKTDSIRLEAFFGFSYK